jgi:hypothetical protein
VAIASLVTYRCLASPCVACHGTAFHSVHGAPIHGVTRLGVPLVLVVSGMTDLALVYAFC